MTIRVHDRDASKAIEIRETVRKTAVLRNKIEKLSHLPKTMVFPIAFLYRSNCRKKQHSFQVGFRTCGKPVSPIKGGTGYVKKDGMSHDQVMDSTHHLQMNFITKHGPT